VVAGREHLSFILIRGLGRMKPTMAFDLVRSCSVRKFAVWVMALCGLAGAASAQSPTQTCVLGGFPVFLHAEGLVEPLADLTVTCTGGTVVLRRPFLCMFP